MPSVAVNKGELMKGLQVSFFLFGDMEQEMRKRMAQGRTRAEVSKDALNRFFRIEQAQGESK